MNPWLPPKWIITLVLAAILIWGVVQTRSTLILCFLSYLISYLLQPVLRFLSKKGISKPIGVIVSFGIGLILAALMISTVFPVLKDEYFHLLDNLPSYIVQVKDKLFSLLSSLAESNQYAKKILDKIKDPVSEFGNIGSSGAKTVVNSISSFFVHGASYTTSLFSALLLPFFVFYLAVDFSAFNKFILSFFSFQYQEKVARFFYELDQALLKFLKGQLIVSFILFILYFIGFSLIGFKLWFLIAIIGGFGSIVPYLGSLSAFVLGIVMSFVTFGDFYHVILVAIVCGIVQFLEGFVVSPKIIGNSTGLHPVAIMLSLIIFGQLFGFMGIVLAVPVCLAIRVFYKHVFI